MPARVAELAKRTGRAAADVLELYEERAAIREYLGAEPRPVAEADAWRDVLALVEPQVTLW